MPYQPDDYRHVNYLWEDDVADKLDPVENLVYRSNKLGEDQRITNTGGGNTSAKIMEKDPLTGQEVEVLWVKGSGGDLRTSTKENFSSLYEDKLRALDSGGLNSNYRMSEDQKKKNTFEFRERIKAVKSTFARNVAIYFF